MGTDTARAPLRVVIADDTADVRLLLRVGLSRFDDIEIVGEAVDGRQAVDACAQFKPDAILLDIAMPEMDGLQAIPHILEVSPGTKVVVLSAFAGTHIQEQARRAGADAYLVKGGNLDEVATTLRAVSGRPAWDSRPGAPAEAPAEIVREELLSVLAHELSTPVAVIHGFAETLKRHGASLSEPEREGYVDAILRAVSQISSLVTTFGDVRGIEIGAIDLSPAHVDLGKFAEQFADDMRQLLSDHRLEVGVDGDVDAVVDQVRIRQVLTNLLSNAAKFSPAGSTIRLDVRRVDDSILMSISDQGQGIPPESAERLFDKFARLERDRRVGGMGLGLYISRGIARAHGGDLVYEPAPGGGARFVLRLPLAEPDAAS